MCEKEIQKCFVISACIMAMFHWGCLVDGYGTLEGREKSWLGSVVISLLVVLGRQNIKDVCYFPHPPRLLIPTLILPNWKPSCLVYLYPWGYVLSILLPSCQKTLATKTESLQVLCCRVSSLSPPTSEVRV